MFLLNLTVLKLFLIQIFFFNYVLARYPFVSTEFIEYKTGNSTPEMCATRTWIPLQPPMKNCEKKWNVFREIFKEGSSAATLEGRLRDDCFNLENKNPKYKRLPYFYYTSFEKTTVHDLVLLCGKPNACKDLENEVNLDIFWTRLKDEITTRKECKDLYDNINISSCPFSSRIDLQHYVFANEKKHRNRTSMKEEELCVDRYGRKYPPPEGLGGKCVMLQHEFLENGSYTTEFFMPTEKRDMIQRISQYPNDHDIRQNATTMNRFVPYRYTDKITENSCMTLHYNSEAFIHCIYEPKDSEKFHPPEPSYFFCPKGENITKSFFQSELKTTLIDYLKHPKYTVRNISERKFEFSLYCYISTDFTLSVINNKLKIELGAKFLGSNRNECVEKHIIETKNGTNVKDYEKKLIESMEDFCPWEDSTTYNICFQTVSEHHFSMYVEALNKIAKASAYKLCHYQVQSDGCYYQIDLTNGTRSRVPSTWIQFIEGGNLTATKTDYKDAVGCGIVYITSEMKKRCYEKSEGKMKEYSMGSNIVICKCNESSCDEPRTEGPGTVDLYRNAITCNQGSSETVLPSPFFYCSVQLSIKPVNGKKMKTFNYTFVDPNIPYQINPTQCWDHQTLSDKLADPEAIEDEFTTCFHSHENQMYECCCKASDTPCNTRRIIDAYFEIANEEHHEQAKRIQIGCNFKTEISHATNETCKSDVVRNDREMKCYGVFQISSKTNNNGNKIKPKLIKENCYWPHPQYHDQYSIFCSKAFFDIDDLVEDKCLSVIFNDFTSSSTTTLEEKNFDRILMLCCNTGVYPENRELLLSRSIYVL
uniref:Uncharacterized protein n=1 Tax=Panagrolaimus sp. ES5 TaxID=591445 RepID=A0AC34GWT7_9BILA